LRITMQFDNQNRVTVSTWEKYSWDTESWGLEHREEFLYNTNSLNSMMSYYAATEDTPAYWQRTTFANDGQGRPVVAIAQNSADSSSWVNNWQVTTAYNANDTTTGNDFITWLRQRFNVFYDVSSGEWYGYNSSFLYMNPGMISEQTEQMYDTYNNEWYNLYYFIFNYDIQNRPDSRLDHNWNGTNWIEYFSTSYTYSTNGNLEQSLVNALDAQTETWHLQNRFTYTWGQSTANDDEITPTAPGIQISSSPNPFTGDVSIKVSSKTTQPVTMNIYNTKGQLVKTIATKTNTSVNWDGRDSNNQPVANGIYFIKADFKGNSKTIKVLKLR
jgi:hypothetical protein